MTSTSFRAISKIYVIINFTIKLTTNYPSNKSIMIWVKKAGYYYLTQPKEKADDWIIILDESIQLGTEKLLVIFGIREKNIPSAPLKFIDLKPLFITSKSNWNGKLVKLKKKLGCIIYAVGDYGSIIKKGLQLAKISHVHDITHRIAIAFKKLLKDNIKYQELIKRMAEMRNKYAQTNIAHLIPPKQRTKSRYQNISTICNWGVNILCFKDKIDISENIDTYEKINWINEYELFIKQLSELNQIICNIEKKIKTECLSKTIIEEVEKILDSNTNNPLVINIKEELNEYFKSTMKLLSLQEKILCCSDIIESAFGKYKYYLSNNPMAGITDLALCIPVFTCDLTQENIKDALENATMKDINKWTKENIGTTLFAQRKKAFAKVV